MLPRTLRVDSVSRDIGPIVSAAGNKRRELLHGKQCTFLRNSFQRRMANGQLHKPAQRLGGTKLPCNDERME
jgi:hypothetical protein